MKIFVFSSLSVHYFICVCCDLSVLLDETVNMNISQLCEVCSELLGHGGLHINMHDSRLQAV